MSPTTDHGLGQVSIDVLDELQELVDLWRYGRTELFVQLNDDPQAHENIVLVLDLQREVGRGGEAALEGYV